MAKGVVNLVLTKGRARAFPEGNGPRAPEGPLHLAHEVGPEDNENQYWKGRDQQLQEYRLLLRRFAAEFHALGLQQPDQGAVVGFRIKCDKLLAGALLSLDDLALEGHRLDAAAFYFGEKLRIDHLLRLAGAHAELAENREQYDR